MHCFHSLFAMFSFTGTALSHLLLPTWVSDRHWVTWPHNNINIRVRRTAGRNVHLHQRSDVRTNISTVWLNRRKLLNLEKRHKLKYLSYYTSIDLIPAWILFTVFTIDISIYLPIPSPNNRDLFNKKWHTLMFPHFY